MSLFEEGKSIAQENRDVVSFLEEAQTKVDATVCLKATNQVQLVKFIYENYGHEGIIKFYEQQIMPWAAQWAMDIMAEHNLKQGEVNALKAMELYEVVHQHTSICSDRLGFFLSLAHPDHVICGANHCPPAIQWKKIWPEGAHLLCFLYSHGFDTVFFEQLNPALYFKRHGESCAEEPGLPHGELCIMELRTRGRELSEDELVAYRIEGQQPEDISVSPQTFELVNPETVYIPYVNTPLIQ
jgi:hypothetical protein